MLIGRQPECDRIEALLGAAREGGGGALLLHGEAGIGKTALLRFARERAEGEGLRVLAARGLETQGDLPYHGLHDLLGPLLEEGAKRSPDRPASEGAEGSPDRPASEGAEGCPDRPAPAGGEGRAPEGAEGAGAAGEAPAMRTLRARLPAAQATALGQAFALGPEGTPARFAVPAAVLGLLAVAAEERPVLAVVDDVQWIDGPSVEALVFAARRLRGDGVAILFGQRDGAGRAVDPTALDSMELKPLERRAAADLLRERHGERLAGAVASGIVGAAGGNPLALVELSRALSDDQLSGREALPPVLPEGLSVERAFASELAALPEDTRRALTVAAAADAGEDAAVLGRALALAGVLPWVLDAAESARVIEVHGPRVDFRHPLLRAAAYHAATPGERRAAHRALADAHPEGAPQRAWHLAAAAEGADEHAAGVLDQAAVQARERGGFASAARAMTRAAELSPQEGERTRRLLDAARDFVAAGDPEQAAARAEAAYDEVVRGPAEPSLRADLEWLLGHVWMRLGRAGDAERLLREAAERVAPTDPGRGSVMLLEASVAQLAKGGAHEAIALARRARATGEGNPVVQALADVMVGQALVATGNADEGVPLIEETKEFVFSLDPVHAPSDVIAIAANALVWTDRYAPARAILGRVIAAAREHGALARLSYPLGAQCVLDFRSGRWADAVANGEEGVRASIDSGADAVTVLIAAFLAEVEAQRGLTEQAIERAEDALERGRRTRTDGFMMFPHHAVGIAHFAAGRHDEAIAALEEAWAWSRRIGTLGAGWLPTQPALIEAYVAAGRTADAERELEELRANNAGDRQPPTAHALIARSRGLVTGEERHYEEALEHHARVASPFERARTELLLGESLRARGESMPARRRLRAALEAFERLGATPWAERAREELQASGVASTRGDLAVVDVLTPHELQVALVVARGATNKEAAAQLFLSPKTVEHHLRATYRKLAIASRGELITLLSAQSRPEEAAA